MDKIIQPTGIGSIIIVDISKFDGNIYEKGKFIEALHTKTCTESYSMNAICSTYVVAPFNTSVEKI